MDFHEEYRDEQLSVKWIARLDYPKNSKIETHIHENSYHLLYILKGGGSLKVGKNVHTLIAGNLYLFREGTPHGFNFNIDSTTLEFKFSISDVRLKKWMNTPIVAMACSPGKLSNLKKCYNLAHLYMIEPHPLLPYRIDTSLKGAILSILQQINSTKNESYFKRAESDTLTEIEFIMCEYLKEHLSEKVTLSSLSKRFGFHPNYIIKIFQEKTGMTPFQYLKEVRVEKAREYLETSDLSVMEIADLVGVTPPYLSRLFKEREGLSPREYQNMKKKAICKDIKLDKNYDDKKYII